jgi:hypothetical protein
MSASLSMSSSGQTSTMARVFDESVLVRPYIESSTSGGAESIGLQRQILYPSYDSCSQAYNCLLLPLIKNRYQPELDAYFDEFVESNSVNDEVSTVIGSGATSEGGFGLTGRLQEVGINHIDYEMCNDLYNGGLVDSAMLCVGVPGVIVAKATPFGKVRCRKDRIVR